MNALKDIPDLKNLAERMQKYRYQVWIEKGWDERHVAKLFNIWTAPTMTSTHEPAYKILRDFTLVSHAKNKLTRSTTMRL